MLFVTLQQIIFDMQIQLNMWAEQESATDKSVSGVGDRQNCWAHEKKEMYSQILSTMKDHLESIQLASASFFSNKMIQDRLLMQ